MAKQNKGEDNEKLFAFLCYLISIIGVVIVLATKKERGKLSIYHAKQGMVLFIVEIIVSVLWTILAFIPYFGWVIGWILWLGTLVLAVMGIINSLNGTMKPLPLIGQYGDKFNF